MCAVTGVYTAFEKTISYGFSICYFFGFTISVTLNDRDVFFVKSQVCKIILISEYIYPHGSYTGKAFSSLGPHDT